MSNEVHAVSLALCVVVMLGSVGCAVEPAPERERSTSSKIVGESTGICGLANNQVVLTKPDRYLCSSGTPSEVSATAPWVWTCGTSAHCMAYFSSVANFDPDRDRRGELIRTVYAAIFDHAISDDVYNQWVNAYNPGGGVGCRGIMQTFLLASPARAQAAAATSASDGALTSYIERLYRALLPSVQGDNTATIAGWRAGGNLTMDQLDAIFLDNPEMQNRCTAAGMQM